MIASGEDSPEALSGFVKFHPQYPVLKVPACGDAPRLSASRLVGVRREEVLYRSASALSRTFFEVPFSPRPVGSASRSGAPLPQGGDVYYAAGGLLTIP